MIILRFCLLHGVDKREWALYRGNMVCGNNMFLYRDVIYTMKFIREIGGKDIHGSSAADVRIGGDVDKLLRRRRDPHFNDNHNKLYFLPLEQGNKYRNVN